MTPKSMTSGDTGNTGDPVTGEESEDEFQDSNDSLPDDPVPVDTLPAPRQSEPPRELDEGAKSNSNEEGGEETPTPSAPPPAPPPAPHTRQPKPPPPPSSRSTRSQAGKIPRMDYKKLNSKSSTNIVNNVYHAKQMPNSHVHMIRALHALQTEESYKLGHVSEPISYKEARTSPYWPE